MMIFIDALYLLKFFLHIFFFINLYKLLLIIYNKNFSFILKFENIYTNAEKRKTEPSCKSIKLIIRFSMTSICKL